jgi:hypothetical protein
VTRDGSPCSAATGPSPPTPASGCSPSTRCRAICLWSLVWRDGDRHPQLELLLQRAVETGRTEGWLAYDADRHWLPDIDLAGLRRYQ